MTKALTVQPISALMTRQLRQAAPRSAALAAGAVLSVLASFGGSALAQTAPDAATQALIAPCAACHGPQGQKPLPGQPSLAAQPRIFLENSLVLIREGMREVPAMQAFVKSLSDEQLASLAKYYAAQTPVTLGTTVEAGKRSRGAEMSAKAGCGSCHRAGYVGFEQVPRLAGQDEAYLLAAMRMFRDNPAPGRDSQMASAMRGFSDAQLAELAHYFATHSGKAP